MLDAPTAEVATKMVIDIGMQTAVIIGITSLLAKLPWPEKWRDIVLPFAACLIGIGTVVIPLYVDVGAVFQGIILGGTVTGLYGAAKDIKQTPQVVANV